MGCSQNYGHLLLRDSITAPTISRGTIMGPATSGTTHMAFLPRLLEDGLKTVQGPDGLG